ncbi:transposase [Thiohalocapsa halophila]|uniref:Transposase n=1 Tax=Thiohalocapsa halophila TaxID=69359 RepID=A0ABS1CDS2_9GAMM|nr:transposase [Thiohalocapsa halophila]
MLDSAQSLPQDPVELHRIIAQLSAQLAESERERAAQTTRIEQLLEAIELLRRKRFAPSADRMPEGQLALFDEAELEALIGALEAALPAPSETPAPAASPGAGAAKRKPVRRPLPEHLPRVERVIDLPDAEKAAMGTDWTFIGYDSAEQLAVIPRQCYVVVTKRAKYVPANEAVPGAEVGVRVAPRAAQIIPKSIAHSSLLAAIVTGKFVDGLPLYRQEKMFAREGIALSRQTMAGLLMQLKTPLKPVAAALNALLGQGAVVQIDETRLQVLDEPGRENTQPSFMWVFCGGPPQAPVRWFEYAPSRAAEVPQRVLFPAETRAPPGTDPPRRLYLQSDGYSAYHVLAEAPEVIDHAGCWAHVRRKFVEAAAGRNGAAAQQMVALIGELYAVERDVRDEDPATRQRTRTARSGPILTRIRQWLDTAAARVLPKSLLGQAIGYTLNQWPTLITFLDDGHLEIDNNRTENAIRPFVVGRKGWLFAGSPDGAETSALLYSLVETAKANGLEPHAYLSYLFEHLPAAKTPEAVAALLPHNLKLDDIRPTGTIL